MDKLSGKIFLFQEDETYLELGWHNEMMLLFIKGFQSLSSVAIRQS